MKLLIIDNFDSFTYNLVQLVCQTSSVKFDVVKNNEINIAKVNVYDKILISPGAGLPKDIPILREIILKYSSNKSILGICLGHQAIAEAFGAKLFNLTTVKHGLAVNINILETNYIYKNIERQFKAGLYHSWAVSEENFPENLKVTTKSEDKTIMG